MPDRRALCLAFAIGLMAAASPRLAWADSVHVVAPGENLFRIALRYGASMTSIARANGLRSPDLVYVGQRLLIPAANQPATSPAGPRAAVPGGVPGATQVHLVARGETLSAIALRYGTTVSDLVRLNGLAIPNRIYAGQRLIVPATGQRVPGAAPSRPPAVVSPGTGRRIVVDLSSQTLTAWQGSAALVTFLVSTGKRSTPTPIGSYRIYARYRSQTMSGPGYLLPGVPYVQYFHGGYAIHGAYWHMAFGTPVSHGCVNLKLDDAAWLWEWASVGTPVTVQP